VTDRLQQVVCGMQKQMTDDPLQWASSTYPAFLAFGEVTMVWRLLDMAVAAQVLADLKAMGIGPDDYNKVNVNGSGISLGYPIACSGTRVLVTLLHEMQPRNARYGL
jgi:hypothetical protein